MTDEELMKYASRAGFDYVDNIVQENPGHRWNDHDVEYAYRDGIFAGAKWYEERQRRELLNQPKKTFFRKISDWISYNIWKTGDF